MGSDLGEGGDDVPSVEPGPAGDHRDPARQIQQLGHRAFHEWVPAAALDVDRLLHRHSGWKRVDRRVVEDLQPSVGPVEDLLHRRDL